MARRVASGYVALLLAAGLAIQAGEPEPWGEEARERRAEMEEMADGILLGHVAGEERAEVERYWATHLRRCPMDGLTAAQYAAAEIQLQQGDAGAAAEALQRVLTGKPEGELRSVTCFNLGEIARRHLNDPAIAVKHYGEVGGYLRHHARHHVVAMFVERGQATEAVRFLEGQIAAAEEKGEKLALLHRLATLYRQLNQPDRALAVYQRITKEFTPADIQAMREAAAREASALFDQIMFHRRREDPEAIEGVERRIHLRARDLRLAGRLDEFEALRAQMRRGFEDLERREREDDERERGEEERERGGEQDEREGHQPGADF